MSKPGTTAAVSVGRMSDVFPDLRYHDAPAAIEWLTGVLGLHELFVVRDGDGRIAHAELGWGDSAVMLGQHTEGSDGRLPVPGGGQVYLVATEPDVRAAFDRATAAGAPVREPLTDEGHGLGFTVADPEGNAWSVGTYRPAPAVGSPGWLEIGVPQPDATREFFAALFGWRVELMGSAGNANFTGPGLRAGLHGDDDAHNIVVYFAVSDIDTVVSRVRALGGQAEDAGPEQQRFGRFAAATDPQGVPFGLHQPPGSAA